MTTILLDLLDEAAVFIHEDLRALIEGDTLADENGEPRLDTLGEATHPHVAARSGLLARIQLQSRLQHQDTVLSGRTKEVRAALFDAIHHDDFATNAVRYEAGRALGMLSYQQARIDVLTSALRALADRIEDVGGYPRCQALTGHALDAAWDRAIGLLAPAPVEAPTCTIPPPGWACTRAPGHDGPCAALLLGASSDRAAI